jgi:hypothetical protein
MRVPAFKRFGNQALPLILPPQRPGHGASYCCAGLQFAYADIAIRHQIAVIL